MQQSNQTLQNVIMVYEESLKIGLKVHKWKTKFMTNIDTTDNSNKLDRNRESDKL